LSRVTLTDYLCINRIYNAYPGDWVYAQHDTRRQNLKHLRQWRFTIGVL